MKKKLLVLAVMAVLLCGCSFYGKNPDNMDNNSTDNGTSTLAGNQNGENMNNQYNETYAMKALELYNKVNELFYIKELNLYLEHYPPRPEDRAAAFLWPTSEMLSAVNSMAGLKEFKESYNDSLKSIISCIDKYRDNLREPPAYQAYPFEFSSDDRFYDDNMWLGLDFLEAYRQTGDRIYLDKCNEVFEFIKSGWSEELGGGIYWCEQKRDTKNTCSNGPAAVLALGLYEETGEKDYFDWGLKIYEWTRKNLKSPENVYWDHVRADGSIDRTTYAYNTGTMLHSAVLLYKSTGEKHYLEEAQKLAEASLDHFAPRREDGKRFFPKENPWFTVVLFRGYQALYEVDGNPLFIDAVIENADHAWKNRDENGLTGRDWSGEYQEDKDAKSLLDVSCMVELYARAAQLKDK